MELVFLVIRSLIIPLCSLCKKVVQPRARWRAPGREVLEFTESRGKLRSADVGDKIRLRRIANIHIQDDATYVSMRNIQSIYVAKARTRTLVRLVAYI